MCHDEMVRSADLPLVAKQAQISQGSIIGHVHHGGVGTFANDRTWGVE